MTLAIIMCGGKSTRTYPLTVTKPKALLPIANRALIEYNLDSLAGKVSEVILIVGYLQEQIREHFGNKYKGIPIRYVEQHEQLGTAHALLQAKDHIDRKVLVMNGDDIYAEEDIDAVLAQDAAILCKKVEDPSRFGVVKIEEGKVKEIIEKPKEFVGDLVSIGLYVFPKEVSEVVEKVEKSERGEHEITDVVTLLGSCVPIEAKGSYLSIGYAWDVLSANRYYLSLLKESDIKGEVEEGAHIKGPVIVGEGTIIRSGAYITGPVVIGENCSIGPNCYIRSHTTIGNNCKVGNAVEIKNTILFPSTNVGHLSYVGDSILGDHTNFGAGTITANLRHDDQPIVTVVKGKKVNTGRRKLGAITGSHVHTGINTSIYPGRKIWPNVDTLPGEVVEKDKVK